MATASDPVPDTVTIRSTPRVPVSASDLGIPATVDDRGTPQHRLVTIGDSLTQGFQSGAISHTDLSFPAIIAHELGWADHFRYPIYPGYGGIPLNRELLVRDIGERFGPDVSPPACRPCRRGAVDWLDRPARRRSATPVGGGVRC